MQIENIECYDLNRKYPTPSNTIFKDRIVLEKAEIVLDNLRELSNQDEVYLKSLETMLRDVIENARFNKDVIYKYALKNRPTKKYKGFPYGRLFGGNCLSNIDRGIRHTIINPNCLDVDMINCHPTILSQLSKLLNVNTPTLDLYVNDRSLLLNELKEKFNLTKDEAKRIPIAIINGGLRFEDYPLKWVKDLEDESALIYESLIKQPIGMEIWNHVVHINDVVDGVIYQKGTRTPVNKGTIVNLLLCKVENEILNVAIEFMRSKNIEITTLCFDGLIIFPEGKWGDNFLEELYDSVYEKLHLKIKFSVKPFNEDISLEGFKTKNVLDLTYENERYIKFSNRKSLDFSYNGVQFHKANMGYGKTTSLINSGICENNRIIYVSCRRALSNEIYTKLSSRGFVHYEQVNLGEDHSKIIIQLDSLWKLRGQYDILILDEIETLQNHLITFEKMKNRDRVSLCYFDRIKYTPKVIVMDANLDYKTINFFKDILKRTDYIFYEYSFQTFKDKQCQVFEYGDSRTFYNHSVKSIIDNVEGGKKLVIPTGSKRFSEQLHSKLTPISKTLVLNGDRPNVSVETWEEYENVIYTSSVLAGNSFDPNHFDKIIAIYSNIHSTGKLLSQQLLRVRNFEKVEIHYLNCRSYVKNENESSIKRMIKKNGISKDNIGLIGFRDFDVEDEFFNLFMRVKLDNVRGTDKGLLDLEEILIEHGMIINHTIVPSDPLLTPNVDMPVIGRITQDKINRIKNAKVMENITNVRKTNPNDCEDIILRHILELSYGVNFDTLENVDAFITDNHNHFSEIKNFKRLLIHSPEEIETILKETYNEYYKVGSASEAVNESGFQDLMLNLDAIKVIEKFDILNIYKSKEVFTVDSNKVEDLIKLLNIKKPVVKPKKITKIIETKKKSESTVSAGLNTKLFNKYLRPFGFELVRRNNGTKNGKESFVGDIFNLSTYNIKIEDLRFERVKTKFTLSAPILEELEMDLKEAFVNTEYNSSYEDERKLEAIRDEKQNLMHIKNLIKINKNSPKKECNICKELFKNPYKNICNNCYFNL